MGEIPKETLNDPASRKAYTRQLIDDIQALQSMIDQNLIETGIQRIGAEQEVCLIDSECSPSTNNVELLDAIDDPHFVPEIAKFNIEINLDPEEFHSNCFSVFEEKLTDFIAQGKEKAEALGTRFVLTGILPTLRKEHLFFNNMTPNPRYQALNDEIRKQRKTDFELKLNGIDEFITSHPNILFEACNTSFQVHLQIEPDEFASAYNWSQLIAGPVLAAVANSPLLMGKRLWDETRIALFQQSVDTRSSNNFQREKEPRVTFGKDWARGSVVDHYKENVSRFNLLFATPNDKLSTDILAKGEIPDLKALRLHNSTVYKWNRACYGVGNGKPHLRIENRYIPSGPTIVDEVANAAFWLGLMTGMPEKYTNIAQEVSFEEARFNFYNAARMSMQTNFKWFGKHIPAKELILNELLPIAKAGLQRKNVDQIDIDRYMGIIQDRVESGMTGSEWANKNYSEMLIGSTMNEATKNLAKMMVKLQDTGTPVSKWPNVNADERERQQEYKYVSQIMSTDVFTVNEDDLVDLVVHKMSWQKIRFIPVENDNDELVGLITPFILIDYFTSQKKDDLESVKDMMNINFPIISPKATTQEAIDLLVTSQTGCLPVVEDNKLVGIITTGDIVKAVKITKKFA